MKKKTGQLDLIPKGPKRFKPPSLDEVLLVAAKAGLPEIEAKKFHCYYESCGWVVGRNKKMKHWASALAGWKLRWEEQRTVGQAKSEHWSTKEARAELKRVEQQQPKEKTNENNSGKMPVLWKKPNPGNRAGL